MLVTGMAIGTLFTLFILPVIYLVVAAEHREEERVELDERLLHEAARPAPV
jgi:hypothetical protein